MKKLYDKYLSKEQIRSLDSTERKQLDQYERTLSVFVFVILFFAFATMINLVAYFIWFSKIALFFTIVSFLLTIPIVWLFSSIAKDYTNMIDQVKEEL